MDILEILPTENRPFVRISLVVNLSVLVCDKELIPGTIDEKKPSVCSMKPISSVNEYDFKFGLSFFTAFHKLLYWFTVNMQTNVLSGKFLENACRKVVSDFKSFSNMMNGSFNGSSGRFADASGTPRALK